MDFRLDVALESVFIKTLSFTHLAVEACFLQSPPTTLLSLVLFFSRGAGHVLRD